MAPPFVRTEAWNENWSVLERVVDVGVVFEQAETPDDENAVSRLASDTRRPVLERFDPAMK